MSEEKLSLVNINGGAAVEMFDIALQKVIENIHDINTATGDREVNLKVKLTPLPENRGIVVCVVSCPTKMCGQEAMKGVADIKIKEGKVFATCKEEAQAGLPFSNVAPIKKTD